MTDPWADVVVPLHRSDEELRATARRARCQCTAGFFWIVRDTDIGKKCSRCKHKYRDAGIPESL